MVTRTYRLLGSWLLVAATFGCGTPSSGKPSQPDTETLADVAATDVIAVADDTDTFVFPDSAPDLPPADTAEVGDMEEDAKVYTYVPADPCAEEPAAPAEGSTCTTVDELRCSDFEQKADKSFDLMTTAGWQVLQVCKRRYVLRCEASISGPLWTKRLAADLVGPAILDAGSTTEGIWCLSGKVGPALEPGLCKGQTSGFFKACPMSQWGRRGCAGQSLIVCGTAETVDALLPAFQAPWHMTAEEQLGDSFSKCSTFGRRYRALNCSQERLACKFKNPDTGQITYPSVPGDCIPDDDTGAHCATTCEEIGMEGPPKW